MLLVFPFCARDREQAVCLAAWIMELGPYPAHTLLVVREYAAPAFDYAKMCFAKVTEIIARDPDNKWPQSAGLMFRSAAKHVAYTTREPFLWCEPDCVPMRAGWLDDIAAEYETALKSGKHFLADLIDERGAGPNYVPHASGLCVYPKNLVQHAGEIFNAYDDVPFDITAGPAIFAQAMQSELLLHIWKAPPFTSWADVEAKIFARRPRCAIFHSAKDESLIRLLRERKNIDNVARPLNTESCLDSNPNAFAAPHSSLIHPLNCVDAVDSAQTPASADSRNPDATIPAQITQHGKAEFGSEIQHSVPQSGTERIRISGNVTELLDTPLIQERLLGDHANAVDEEKPTPITTTTVSRSKSSGSAEDVISNTTAPDDPESWHDQTPWESRESSIAEIRQLASRLKQFQTSSPRVKFVRELLHQAGVIVLPYRYKRRKGWKRKRGAP